MNEDMRSDVLLNLFYNVCEPVASVSDWLQKIFSTSWRLEHFPFKQCAFYAIPRELLKASFRSVAQVERSDPSTPFSDRLMQSVTAVWQHSAAAAVNIEHWSRLQRASVRRICFNCNSSLLASLSSLRKLCLQNGCDKKRSVCCLLSIC